MMMIYYSIQSLIIDISTCTDSSWSLHHPFHLHGELFLWFTTPDGSDNFLKVNILRSQGHDRWCAQADGWKGSKDHLQSMQREVLLNNHHRFYSWTWNWNHEPTCHGMSNVPSNWQDQFDKEYWWSLWRWYPFGTSLGSDTAWSCYTKTFIRKGPSWLVMNGALEVRSTTLVTVWVCIVEKLGSKSEKTAQLENVPELFELLRWSSCLWDIEWQHVPYQTSNFYLRVNSSAFFALGQCLWPLSGPCELFDALGMQYPGQTPAPGWNSFGPISPPRPTQPTAPAQHVLQQPKGHVLQNLAVN